MAETNFDVLQKNKTSTTQFIEKINKEKKVKVLGNEGFISSLGTVYTIHINGVIFSLPFDGKYHDFPESIAKILEKKLSKIAKANNAKNETAKIY
jgi:diphthamide synthase subunit DPH2